MKNPAPLLPGNYYHVYTKGVNGCDIFRNEYDYTRFLTYYDRYIEPIANTFAWCLMKNHLHLLIQVKDGIGYRFNNADRSIDAARFEELKWKTTNLSSCEAHDSVKLPNPSKHFAHLFNTYAKYFNKKYNRKGNLFQRPFKRKQINDSTYFKRVVTYIHQNPIHHNFCEHPMEYLWSSYLTCIAIKPTRLNREMVIGWFDDLTNFKDIHHQKVNVFEIEKWLEI